MSSIDDAKKLAEQKKAVRKNLRAVYWSLFKTKAANAWFELTLLFATIFVCSGLLTIAFTFWIWLFGRYVFGIL